MCRWTRYTLVLMLIAAQAAFGASAGRVICLGAVDSGPPRDSCCHSHERPSPAPIAPHDGGDDCPCIDVVTSVARAERAGDDFTAAHGVLALLPRPHEVVAEASRPAACPLGRPPGPAPGLRTTRLLI